MSLMDQLKIINFIKHWPLLIDVFNILFDEIGSMYKYSLYINIDP